MGETFWGKIGWLPGHSELKGDEEAEMRACRQTELDVVWPEPAVGLLLKCARKKVNDGFNKDTIGGGV